MNTRLEIPHSNLAAKNADSRPTFPARVMDIEITEPLPSILPDASYPGAWILVRLHTEPIGVCLLPIYRNGLDPDQLGALLWQQLGDPIRRRVAAVGLTLPTGIPATGLKLAAESWPLLTHRSEMKASAPFISVVICTRGRPDVLDACLTKVDVIEYPHFEVVIVDNAPVNNDVELMLISRESDIHYRYVVEPRGGLSWARNAGASAARGEVVAFLDDDGEPDGHWLTAIADGFRRSPKVGCVTGMILPMELVTPAQQLFESLGGHSKGRDFSSTIFSLSGGQSPLYPLPAFGAGANMAFRREALEEIGGFDVALGAGTVALSGEDTLALTLILLSGYDIAYEPAALVRHDHRRELDGLARQLFGYGAGLTAYYAALLRHRPSVIPGLLRLVPTAIGYLGGGGTTCHTEQAHLLRQLMRRQRLGMAAGPLRYIRSVRHQTRAAAQSISVREVMR